MENNNTTTCRELYDNGTFYALLYFRCALAIISILFISSMLAIMVLFKKYRFFTQRLILYLAISTLAYQIVSVIDVASIRAYSDEKALQYCKAIGFMTQVVGWWPPMATTVIMFDIFVRVVLKKSTEHLEIPYQLVIFGLPLLTSWIPFVYSAYGPVQYFCWISSQKDTNEGCVRFTEGIIIRAALLLIPFYTTVLLMIAFLAITICYLYKSKRQYSGSYNPQEAVLRKKAEQELKPMLCYPIVFIVSALMSGMVLVFFDAGTKERSTISLIIGSVILSVLYRLQGVFITVVFVLDPETRKKLNFKDIRAAVKSFYEKEQTADYECKLNALSDSLKAASQRFEPQCDSNIDETI